MTLFHYIDKLFDQFLHKKNSNGSDSQSTRVLRLNQFINIYNQIKLQSDALKTFDKNDQTNSKTSNATASYMTESKFYDT